MKSNCQTFWFGEYLQQLNSKENKWANIKSKKVTNKFIEYIENGNGKVSWIQGMGKSIQRLKNLLKQIIIWTVGKNDSYPLI